MKFKKTLAAFVLIFAWVLSAQAAPRCQDFFATREEKLEPARQRDGLLPVIQVSELTNLKTGEDARFIFAEYKGQPVIGKELPKEGSYKPAWVINLISRDARITSAEELYRGPFYEAIWLKELNDIGLGAKFYGIVSFNGERYILMERIDGYNTNLYYNPKIDIPESALREMRRQFQVLISNGIAPYDLQFQISFDRKRVVLVDPEFFERRQLSKRAAEEFWDDFVDLLKRDFDIIP